MSVYHIMRSCRVNLGIVYCGYNRKLVELNIDGGVYCGRLSKGF